MSRTALIKWGKYIVGLAVIAAVIIGVAIAAVAIHAAMKSTQSAQIAQQKIASDGTTHDLTLVWPDGKQELVSYHETVTPRSTAYTGPKNTHYSEVNMISFNPLDSANKAGERFSPNTFVEGDRPAIILDETGAKVSKADGAQSVGQGGSNPVMGEYMGWAVMGVLAVVGLLIISGVGKWLWAEFKKVEPAIVAAIAPQQTTQK